MAGKAPSHVTLASTSSAPATKSPDSDVSPGTKPAPKPTDYFATLPDAPENAANRGANQQLRVDPTVGGSISTGPSTATSTSTIGLDGSIDSRRPSYAGSDRPLVVSRKSSSASVVFRSPRNPSLPQGLPRKTDNKRLRESSPEPIKFKQHVGFDNLPAGEATKQNASSLTLHVKHQGYQSSRRSRIFMVGVDDHAYSDHALSWLLSNMVDDGDEVICVHVLENAPRSGEKNYRAEAEKLLQSIVAKNELNKAISIVLEYSVGKLHATFQQLLQMYQPSMLIVGTKGRSLGGIQAFVNTRSSFSKYCLQYSPVPVVVVRPDEKRLKKKSKRTQDPSRQSYAQMLQHNGGKHEADTSNSGLFELESRISPDEEAHRVAAAIGLPATFDPTIKPFHISNSRRSSPANSRRSSPAPMHSPLARRTASPSVRSATNDSGDDDSGDDDDEFEAEPVSAKQPALSKEKQAQMEREQKRRLHDMEVGEAKALLKSGQSTELEDDDDDDDSQEAPVTTKPKN